MLWQAGIKNVPHFLLYNLRGRAVCLSVFPVPHPLLFMKGREQTSQGLKFVTRFSQELKFSAAEPMAEDAQEFRLRCRPCRGRPTLPRLPVLVYTTTVIIPKLYGTKPYQSKT